MTEKRVQIQDIIEYQLPTFVREDFPLIAEFLKQYYISQESPGSSTDLIQNIDQYLKLESLTNDSEYTELSTDISFTDTTINTKFDFQSKIFGTYKFPEKYGLIKIDDEIILYTEKNDNSFLGCIRGFSGVTSYASLNSTDSLTFSVSEIAEHSENTKIINLSSLFLKQFLSKIKYQITPGFEDREFNSNINSRLFISRSKDFYQTKGTDYSFKILFGALYGENVEVIKPKDNLFRPSDSQYRVTKDLVVEAISGNPLELLNQTLFQNEYQNYGIQKAYAAITNVEKLLNDEKEYYKLSVDFDYSKDITLDGSIFGEFSSHPKTKVINQYNLKSFIVNVVPNPTTPPPNNVFVIDGTIQKELTLVKGNTYRFDVSNSSNTGHPFIFQTKSGNTLSSTHYSITLNGISGQSGSFIDFTINSTSPNETIQYNCSNHNGMGANLNISDSFIDEVNVLDVDSTIGFPNSGELAVTYSSGLTGVISYSSKSINQFFNISNITSSINPKEDVRLNAYAYGYVGFGTKNRVDVRISNVLSKLSIKDDTYYYSRNDTATIKSLGITTSSPLVDSWIYNLSTKFDVRTIEKISGISFNGSDFSYKLSTNVKNNFKVGDNLTLNNSISISKDCFISNIIDAFNFTIKGQGNININQLFFNVQRKILKPQINFNSSKYSYLSEYTADVQNTYVKFNQDLLVASSSIPNYYNQALSFYDRKIILDGSYSGEIFTISNIPDHGYYTGDAVYYSPNTIKTIVDESNVTSTSKFENLQSGVYYIKRINSNQFKLASNQSDISNNIFISVSGIVTSNTLEYADFYGKVVQHQNLFREVKLPINESKNYLTSPGKTGVLINGVEILNYKSNDTIYYGKIKNLEILSSGNDYDIINPPNLTISDNVGYGASAACSIKGSLKRIDIIDSGFDYVSIPIVTIEGGNGFGAKVDVNTSFIDHSVSFNATQNSSFVNLANNTIGFSTFHKFRNVEKIIYKTDKQPAISGLSTDSIYYVKTINSSTISLYNTEADVISGLNTISFSSYGTGVHRLQSFEKKQIISNISVVNSGFNYQNKKRVTSYLGINTASDQINIDNHQYESEEIVQYSFDTSSISGLSSSISYIVTKIDNDNFKLSNVGLGSTSKLFYYNTNQYIDLKSTGSGNHYFNYEPITVNINGEIGVSTFSGQDFSAKIQPIFRGSIESAQIINHGVGYGSSEILNYNKQPIFTLSSGSSAELLPIINNGRIIEVLVTNEGSGYNSPPELVVFGSGRYAKLIPIIVDGKIKSVIINSPGIGYSNETTVNVISSGSGALFYADIQRWTVNLFEKYLNIISDDDGILCNALNDDFGIQYSHLYAPRKLRESIYGKGQNGEIKYGVFDLQKLNQEEIESQYHSPIIGWAYDGNPIYGPYGLTEKTKGSARLMKSGYELKIHTDRPPTLQYPLGFFVEDYEFNNSGDLDEFNGRFCVTPDYPNGIYAYFATISQDTVKNSSTFNKYKIPTFPYLIGNSFKSKPNQFNFERTSNQSLYDISSLGWFRNTTPYNLSEKNSNYDFLLQPNKIKAQTINIDAVSKGNITSIGIVTGGFGYQVNDSIIFNDQQGSQKAKAKVSRVLGKSVTNISVASTTISGLEIFPFNSSNEYIAISTLPHKFSNNDLISLSGFSTSVNHLQNSFNIGVRSERLILNIGINTSGNTGIVTYLSVLENLSDDISKIRENDILSLNNEKVKVLNIDLINSRIRVLRNQENTVSSAHTASTIIYENSRKFTFTSLIEDNVKFQINKEIYFNPKESLGIGTIIGVGIGTTITFSNPGAGITQIFIPIQSIYLPNHKLVTGDELVYNSNGGSIIGVSTNGISTSSVLQNQSTLYVGKISEDLIGISTHKIGIGSTGTFVGITSTTTNTGLLYFTGIGTDVYHSFKTIKENVVTAEANKNIVTVATASTHGLNIADDIQIYVNPKVTNTIIVKYDDYNRRIIFNPKSFISPDVDISNNTISIDNHGFHTGDKIIHTATSPSGGLINEQIYYIVRFTKNKIKLCLHKYQTFQFNLHTINITSASSGTISLINPPIKSYKNNNTKFDLSDSSLSYINGSTLYSAFDLNLYSDLKLKNIYDSSAKNNYFEVSKIGQVGISSNASLILKVTDSLPKELYYKFTPINLNYISDYKKEIYIDTEVLNYNLIEIVDSVYSGKFNISGIGTTNTFTYNILENAESSSYNLEESIFKYSTNSKSAYGGIENISISYNGSEYSNIVGITTIITNNGYGAILEPFSNSIGKIISNRIEDIGFDFPSDKTLRPVCNLPEILLMQPLASFQEIGITSFGKNYTIPSKLIVLDGYTEKIVTDVDLIYNIGDTKVKILKNTFGIYNVSPKIIPTNNQNGIGIANITFNNSTKEVSVGLNTGFSDVFPFSIGDKVLIENISVGVGSTGIGYNSSNYGYSLFTLTKVPFGASALGGSIGIVTYSLSGYLNEGTIPGNFDSLNSSGRIIAEKDFPVFDVKLKKNNFILGETIISESNTGQVESWNSEIELLKVSTTKDFKVGEILIGKTSKTQAAIKSKIDFNAEVEIEPTSIVKNGWNRETGFLNYNTERISDNNYYQKFSYSLKSKIPLEIWDDSVSSLNHTSGFLKFSDLIIESNDENYKGVYSEYDGGSIDVIVDIYDEKDINCYSNFDLVIENSLNIGSEIFSDEIYFNSRVLTDYYESFGNRVLIIDDISTRFNSNPRPTKFSIIDLFDVNIKSKKYFTYVKDKRDANEGQFLIVSLLQNGSNGFLNQYGRVESQADLGSFDFLISGSEGQLLFYPTKFSVNNYNVSFASFDIKSSTSGIGSTALGDVVDIRSTQSIVSLGTTTNIVSIATTYRSSKLILEISGNNGEYEFDELNIIHNGIDVELLEYGQLTDHSFGAFSSSGLGTYNAYISGNNVKIDFIPNVGIAATINTLRVSIASTLSTGIGTQYLGFDSENISFLDSSYVSIASSSFPVENIIARYSNVSPDDHNCSYYLISIEDTTNNRYEMSEVIVLNTSSTAYITEYGNLTTNSGLGTVGAAVSSSHTNLYYTPLSNINVQVRVFQTSIQIVDLEDSQSTEIDFNNAFISAGFGFYQGTEIDVRRSFELTHKQKPIFLQNFVGNDSSIVDISENTISIPENFFVTGEEVEYSYNISNASPIGIASTSFVGVGTTSLLPAAVYIIKINDKKIKLARSAEDALKTVPIPLDITSLGIGTNHTFTSKNQNTKCIIAIDNYIQSPIVSTLVTTGLTTHIGLVDDVIRFSGITSFFSGDLIKINDEIMKINTIGIGSTNHILVDRPWMGTGLSTHSEYSVVTKVNGDYNIVDNTLNFITAPQGPVPIGSISNSPDERYWVGVTTFSKFQGRSFIRSAPENSIGETYDTNYVFDDISQSFNATQKTFTLKSNNQNVTGFSTNNSVILIDGIFQGATGQLPILQDYTLLENSGITSITFTGTATSISYDPNNANIPIGGKIVSVGSTGGFGYQPLVSAGGTAIVSVAGTISSISIGNSGSGYRSGIQTNIRIGITTFTTGVPSIEFIGTGAISGGRVVSIAITNPGTGYTSTNPPLVIFDAPLSYSDIPLIYSSSSPSGFGTQATIDIVVGQGSSVIDFEIKNIGYNYGQKQILTIASGGISGIPTDLSKPFLEFQLSIEKTISDEFSGWNFGELEVLDKIENQFDGIKKSFTIAKNSSPLTIRSAKGSNIDVQATLLIFLNDILQVPGEGYKFTGGSVITFAEAPRGSSGDYTSSGDKCKILFYKGSGDVDVVFRDVLETVKTGDNLTIKNQEKRLVTNIVSSDTVETNPYNGNGIDSNSSNLRTVEWCKQTADKVINGQIVSKSRILNEALINPTTNIIQSVGTGSTIVYVESVRSFFDSVKENETPTNIKKIVLISQDSIVGASATAVVSIAGTISSIIISDGGVGYSTAPEITIGNPVGLGTTQRASASSIISIGGTVSSIIISSPGTGYTSTNPPQVLIEVPEIIYEINTSNSYEGDFGIIVGFGTTTSSGQDQIIFDFYIPNNSFLRNTSIVSTAVTVSTLNTGDYFVVSNSNVGLAITSISSLRIADSTTIGVGTQFVDNVYQAKLVSTILSEVIGIGTTYVRRVYAPISTIGVGTIQFSSTFITFDSTPFTFDSLSGGGSYTGIITTFNSFGNFNWGKIILGNRNSFESFNFYGLNGISGISTSAIVSRLSPLKYNNYL